MTNSTFEKTHSEFVTSIKFPKDYKFVTGVDTDLIRTFDPLNSLIGTGSNLTSSHQQLSPDSPDSYQDRGYA